MSVYDEQLTWKREMYNIGPVSFINTVNGKEGDSVLKYYEVHLNSQNKYKRNFI